MTRENTDLVPLQHVPIAITVEGVAVAGEIVSLYPNDMSVVILLPVSGFGAGLHVPHFKMYRQNWLGSLAGRETKGITERGREQAEWLLRCLYDHACGRPAGWGVYAIGTDGWTRVERDRIP